MMRISSGGVGGAGAATTIHIVVVVGVMVETGPAAASSDLLI
jgi:hypothetical protein